MAVIWTKWCTTDLQNCFGILPGTQWSHNLSKVCAHKWHTSGTQQAQISSFWRKMWKIAVFHQNAPFSKISYIHFYVRYEQSGPSVGKLRLWRTNWVTWELPRAPVCCTHEAHSKTRFFWFLCLMCASCVCAWCAHILGGAHHSKVHTYAVPTHPRTSLYDKNSFL